jgi:hypothetical protein
MQNWGGRNWYTVQKPENQDLHCPKSGADGCFTVTEIFALSLINFTLYPFIFIHILLCIYICIAVHAYVTENYAQDENTSK